MTFFEIVNETLVRTKLTFYPFWKELGPNFHIWAHWPKIRKICISSVLLTF